MLRTAVSQSSSLPDFSELHAPILAFDTQQKPKSDSMAFTALYHQVPNQERISTSHQPRDNSNFYPGNDCGRGRGCGRGAGRFQPPQYQFNTPAPNAHPPAPNGSWPTRAPWSNGILGPSPQWCPNCQTNQHILSQCPHRFAGPIIVAPPFAGSHSFGDPNWYPDTGTTHHMTAMTLNNPQPYGGPYNVYRGNSDAMPVSHFGNLYS